MPRQTNIQKVLVIGSGPIVIGQAAEFDYAGTQACLALKEENIDVVLVNNNPATIMTDETIADHIYIEPLTIEVIEAIIEKEKPDGIIGTLGGQTGLNLTVELFNKGILQKHHVKLLGTSVTSIEKGEDREKFRQLMYDINEPVSESKIIHTFEDGAAFVKEIGYPVIIRPAYTLGGSGGGFARNDEELETVLNRGLTLSPIHQVLIEKSIKGWKEIEYEVMRDENDTCVIVCNMENLDPVGVHTGDSIVVAPSQTLTDVQYQMLRDASLKIIRALDIVGGCNIQFALDPSSNKYNIIEVNPRVSRSSALASKATGYPIARIAAKIAIGFHLDEIINPITKTTFASFEPALDYVIVKIPRFPFDKFSRADRKLGTQMKATGEVMAIDRTFEGALNKGLRSLELGINSLHLPVVASESNEALWQQLEDATDRRLFAIAELFVRGITVKEIAEFTQIDAWFLERIKSLIDLESQFKGLTLDKAPESRLKLAKKLNISDARLAQIFNVSEKVIRNKWKEFGIKPGYKLVDTCAAEFKAVTPYYYSTWHGEDEAETTSKRKILVIGSGPIRIGQGIEFDYCSVQAALSIKKLGYEAVVINNNPETVSTDYSIADRLYFEPLALEDILHVIAKEKVEGVLIQFGGQTAINLAKALEEEGIKLLGTTTDAVDQLEDRHLFYDLLKELEIPHIEGRTVHEIKDLVPVATELGYPVLVRPSYVIGGQSMHIFYNQSELENFFHLKEAFDDRSWPLLIDRYVSGLECEVDAVSDGKDVLIPGLFEHIEKAGVHSGDSIALFPSISISQAVQKKITEYTEEICRASDIRGLVNIQFVVADDTVYVLEVNPRASRTIPIVSKVTGIPMVELAVSVQLGALLSAQGKGTGLLEPPHFYSVKAPVFSTSKLKRVDPSLGPEMKSTGECLGLGDTVEEAFEKAVFLAKENPMWAANNEAMLFCTVADREKPESLPLIKEAIKGGFKILATKGTSQYFQENGVEVTETVTDPKEIKKLMAEDRIQAMINIPTQGEQLSSLGFQMRELAIQYQVPLFTCLDTVKAAMELQTQNNKALSIKTLKAYRDHQLVTYEGE